MKIQNFITFRMFSNAGSKALEDITKAVHLADINSKKFNGWISSQEDDIHQYKAFCYPTTAQKMVSDAPLADCLVTCADLIHYDIVKDILKQSKSKYLLWFIGKSFIKNDLKMASAFLEFMGYDLILFKDSSLRVGIPYNDERFFLLGKLNEDLIIMPEMQKFEVDKSLISHFNISRDPDANIIDVNGVTYYRSLRPWNHISIVNDGVLDEKTLGWKYGASYYCINDKCHRITSKELASFLGQDDIKFSVPRPITKVYYMLKEPPYKMWEDIIKRLL